MEIAFHIGANCTDEDRLLKSILRNVSPLLQQGIAVPGPGKYRALLRETIQGLDGLRPRSETREILMDAILEEDKIKRIVLTNDNFISIPRRAFDQGVFYPQIEDKISGICSLFPDDELSFFLTMRHPVSFLQDMLARSETTNLASYLGGLSPLDVQWSDVIARIRHAAPHCELHVWCNEDTPIIWEDLIRLQSGIAPDTPVTGQFDMISQIISPEGQKQLSALTLPANRKGRHAALADIIEAYGLTEQTEEIIDLPSLSNDMITAMSEGYEDDLDVIAEMDGVNLVLPFS